MPDAGPEPSGRSRFPGRARFSPGPGAGNRPENTAKARASGASAIKHSRTAAVLLAVALVAGCGRSSGSDSPKEAKLPAEPKGGFDPPVTVIFEGAPELKVEVASRPDQRSRGLMGRTELPDGTGMLFLFSKRSTGGFWMLGTLIPLSIAYIDGDRVVATKEMVPCTFKVADNCPKYLPGAAYTAAVEAPAGFFPKYGVAPGTRVRIVGATSAPK